MTAEVKLTSLILFSIQIGGLVISQPLSGIVTMASKNRSFSLIPTVKAQDEEAELVDPQTELREKCNTHGNIQDLYGKYQECNDRVNSRSKTTENCMEELFDYLHELDHCVAKTLWSKLK